MRVMLLHNPAAGASVAPSADALAGAIRAAGHEVVYHSARAPGWRRALQDAGDLVVAAGGDGTVAEILCALPGCGVPATVLPVGTANNIAAALGLLGEPETLVHHWPEFRRRRCDLGRVRGLHRGGERRFFEAVGWGALTDMIGALDERAEGLNASIRRYEGLRGYVSLLRRMLEARAAAPVHVLVDGVDRSGDYLMIEVLNIGFVGPRLALGPTAHPGDGALDVLLVGEAEREAMVESLAAHAAGTPVPHPLPLLRARHVELRAPRGQRLLLRRDDHVRPPVAARVEIGVEPGAVEVLAPV